MENIRVYSVTTDSTSARLSSWLVGGKVASCTDGSHYYALVDGESDDTDTGSGTDGSSAGGGGSGSSGSGTGTSGKNPGSPKTGDDSHVGFWFRLGVGSLLILFVLLLKKRRKDQEK